MRKKNEVQGLLTFQLNHYTGSAFSYPGDVMTHLSFSDITYYQYTLYTLSKATLCLMYIQYQITKINSAVKDFSDISFPF